jgi:hypothetical protein
MPDKRIPNLSAYELRGTQDVALYSQALRDMSRAIAMEIDYTAAELQATLSRAGLSLGDKFTARVKAWKVTRRLRRARDLYNGAAVEAVKFWATYKQEYDVAIQPQRQAPAQWKWNA